MFLFRACRMRKFGPIENSKILACHGRRAAFSLASCLQIDSNDTSSRSTRSTDWSDPYIASREPQTRCFQWARVEWLNRCEKRLKHTGDSGLMRLACPGYLQRLSRGFSFCHRSTARFEPDDEKRAEGSRGPKTTQTGERWNSNAW